MRSRNHVYGGGSYTRTNSFTATIDCAQWKEGSWEIGYLLANVSTASIIFTVKLMTNKMSTKVFWWVTRTFPFMQEPTEKSLKAIYLPLSCLLSYSLAPGRIVLKFTVNKQHSREESRWKQAVSPGWGQPFSWGWGVGERRRWSVPSARCWQSQRLLA